MDQNFILNERIPSFYGAIVLYFPLTVSENSIRSILGNGLECTTYSNMDYVEIKYREVSNVVSWEIDDLLDALFSDCDLGAITDALSTFSGSALLDISFIHYEKYPALIFSGKNMDIIHRLKADISIDPY